MADAYPIERFDILLVPITLRFGVEHIKNDLDFFSSWVLKVRVVESCKQDGQWTELYDVVRLFLYQVRYQFYLIREFAAFFDRHVDSGQTLYIYLHRSSRVYAQFR